MVLMGGLRLLSNKVKEVPIWEKLNLSFEEAAEYTGIGINKLREITKEPGCTFALHIGNKTLIKRKELELFNSKTYAI